jgi:hypothetical protein
MAPTLPTPASLAVFLITQGCLPLVFEPDAVAGQSPVPGKTLTDAERSQIGLTTPGTTVGYRVDGVDVFLDMGGDHATVWFANGDFTAAAILLEEMLRRIFKEEDLQLAPALTQEGVGTLTRRIIITPSNSRRVAVLSVTFGPPDAAGADRMFFTRIFPQERQLAS